MVPVGGTYTIESTQVHELLKHLNPRVTLPMHYRLNDLGFEVLEPLSNFASLCEKPVFYDSDTITLDKNTPTQIAILKYAQK